MNHFKAYNPGAPLPFILLFEEDPGEGDYIDGDQIRSYEDRLLKGVEHKEPTRAGCFCERGGHPGEEC